MVVGAASMEPSQPRAWATTAPVNTSQGWSILDGELVEEMVGAALAIATLAFSGPPSLQDKETASTRVKNINLIGLINQFAR
jgi:hypothetical protein